ncbi:aminopeptidase N [Microlunatus lacustris]
MTTPSPDRRYPSLRRTEAMDRAAALAVTAVDVELDLTDPEAATFGSRSTLRFSSRAAETFVDFRGEELLEATLNGQPLDVADWRAGRIALSDLQPENTLVVAGRMAYSSDGEGLHRHVDPADGATYLYAMSFLDAAPRWFACFDQPDLKARYRFTVAAPAHWTVLGNGPSVPAAAGRWTIVPPEPLSTYIVTLVAGPYASVSAEHDGIRLGFHARASLRAELEDEARDMIEVTAQSFDHYHRLFGVRYPFGEYHQAFVPDFNAGAMENPGCVTFRDHYVFRGRATDAERAGRASVIAHEMAHQWFGDLVTMRWWDDLWLNESFAEYLAHRCCTDATRYPVWTEFGIRRKNWGAVADQAPSTHPVAGTGAVDAAAALQDFDGISYAKGAAVLRQLVAYLGDDVFLAGLRAYVEHYAFGNAEFAELIACWTEAGAVDLEDWAAAWLRTAGMDTLDLGTAPSVTVAGPDGGRSPRPHAVTVVGVDAGGAVTPLQDLVLRNEAAPVTVPASSVLVVPDGTDATWAKVRFGPDGWAGVAAVLPAVQDEAVLVVVHNAIRDAVRDATLSSGVALDLVTSSLDRVQSEVLVTVVLGSAAGALAGSFCPVPERAARLARVHALADAVVASSPAGSDRQLAGFRRAVESATDVQRLRAWSEGLDLPPGLALDSELTWVVVERLIQLTGDDDVLARTLARDTSSSAAVHAARVRAARPTAEAKNEAWRLLVEPSSASAYEVYATAEGFFRAGQEELTAPYVERYFAEIGGTAEFRRGWALGRVAGLAFPDLAADARTVALAEQTLAGELADPVRRELVDGLDQLRRAVTSLERFAG